MLQDSKTQGFSELLWVMTDLEATYSQRLYLARMKIEESFRDLKRLLGMTRLRSGNAIQAFSSCSSSNIRYRLAIGAPSAAEP